MFFIIFIVICNIYSYSFANSIHSMKNLEKITINSTPQWIYVSDHNDNLPVLLFLHGGPGFAMLPILHQSVPDLEKYFIVVNWDQRGAGKSFSKNISTKSMTLNQLVEDAHQLTLMLKKRYQQKKIYLMGHSFGTMIGVILISKYPEDYYNFIGIGQVVNVASNEIGSYEFALNSAIENKNDKAHEELKKIGRPDTKLYQDSEKSYQTTSRWVEYFGGSLFKHKNIDPIYELIFNSPVYKNDKNKILQGYDFCDILFDDKQVHNFNLIDIVKNVKIPVYFLMGKHDAETPYSLIKENFVNLNIKNKELIIFDNSAHFPFYEEPVKFIEVMKNIIEKTEKA